MKDLLNRYIDLQKQCHICGINLQDYDYGEIEEILMDKYHIPYLALNMLESMAMNSVTFKKKVLFDNDTILNAWYLFYPEYKGE